MKTRLEMAYINKKEAAFVNDGLLLKWHRAGAPVAEGNGQRYQSETRLFVCPLLTATGAPARYSLFFLVPILPKTLLPFVSSDFMAFSFLTARHSKRVLMSKKYVGCPLEQPLFQFILSSNSFTAAKICGSFSVAFTSASTFLASLFSPFSTKLTPR